jgi:zinc/manganese transport system ATP-binding protein
VTIADVHPRGAAPPDLAAVAAVELGDAAVRLGGQTIWSEASLEIEPGEFVAVLGPNGSGKSTLLRVLLGQQALTTGTVSVLGATPRLAKREIGYLPQRHAFDAATRIRGVDLVRLGLDGARWGLPLPGRTSDRRRVEEAIALVGAGGYARRPIGECSGGEQQRLLIAAALVSQPRMLFLDEPLDSLDLPNQTAVSALLNRICREQGMTILLVAHDVNPLLAHVDRVVYVAAGRILSGPPEQVITSETLSELYGSPVEVLQTSDGRLVVVGQPEAPHHHSDRHAHQ